MAQEITQLPAQPHESVGSSISVTQNSISMPPCLARSPDPLRRPSPAVLPPHRRHLNRLALRLLDHPTTPNHLKSTHAHLLRRRPTTFLYNLLIRAYTLNSSPLSALLLYHHLLTLRLRPDKFTFPFALSACADSANLTTAKQLHASAVKSGFTTNTYLNNVLLHMYYACADTVSARRVFDTMRVRTIVSWTSMVSGLVHCGDIDAAREVFEAMPKRNVVSWTAMIDGCARNGRPEEAFELFWRMQEGEVEPNEFTVVGLLIGCTELGSFALGRWVHEFARKNGVLEKGAYVGTALIDMYSKCGSLEDAVTVFRGMRIRSLATWNSMISSLGVHGRGSEAISLFEEMEMANVRPDRITFVGLLYACVKSGMVEEGLELFRYMGERYDIVAGWEHYDCLVELFGCADGKQMRKMVKNLLLELDVESQRMFLGASKAHGNVELEKVVCKCIRQMVSVEGDDLLPRIENQCYEWEVG